MSSVKSKVVKDGAKVRESDGTWGSAAWDPVERGSIYCAPACGSGCTREEFERVTRAAVELCAELGPGWEPRVWENMRWHGEVYFGGVHVSLPKDYDRDRYTAYLGARGESSGFSGVEWCSDKDPRIAIRKMAVSAMAKIAKERRQWAEAEEDLLRCGVLAGRSK
jgi:hypothetical protein